MEMPRLSKSVRRVVQLQYDESGNLVPTVVYKRRSRKRKASSSLRPLEKSVRKMARAQATFANTYLRKHNRSSRKRRDGWLSDFVSNCADAGKKARKPLRITKSYKRWPTPLS
jgi:hypothetical protein